jgi:hypothetical protein
VELWRLCSLNLGTRWSGQLHTPATLNALKEFPVLTGYEAGCAPEPFEINANIFLRKKEKKAMIIYGRNLHVND